MAALILVRGGGDLASGAIFRLFRAGLDVLVSELAQPLAVRRLVSFSQAVYDGEIEIEGIRARRVDDARQARFCFQQRIVPVMVDPCAEMRHALNPLALVDGRLTKQPPDLGMDAAPLVIGLGPGFVAGENCHAVIETVRGPFLGRVIWQGAAEDNTGLPDAVGQFRAERVLRAPAAGTLVAHAQIGDQLRPGDPIAEVGGQVVRAAFAGVLRGLIQPGLDVQAGMKIGDLDPRNDPRLCRLVSDKSLAVGGGVLEALLARPEIRARMWG